jgi:hypothetical protein
MHHVRVFFVDDMDILSLMGMCLYACMYAYISSQVRMHTAQVYVCMNTYMRHM